MKKQLTIAALALAALAPQAGWAYGNNMQGDYICAGELLLPTPAGIQSHAISVDVNFLTAADGRSGKSVMIYKMPKSLTDLGFPGVSKSSSTWAMVDAEGTVSTHQSTPDSDVTLKGSGVCFGAGKLNCIETSAVENNLFAAVREDVKLDLDQKTHHVNGTTFAADGSQIYTYTLDCRKK